MSPPQGRIGAGTHGFSVGDFAARGKTRWYPATIKAVVTSNRRGARLVLQP